VQSEQVFTVRSDELLQHLEPRFTDPTDSAHQHFADNVVLGGLTYKFGQ
jgi:hypothetical protein